MNNTARNVAIGVAVALAVLVVKTVTLTNGETRYKRPGPTAGAQAMTWWDFYWNSPTADTNRCYFPFIGGQAPAMPPPQTGCVNPKPCVPHAAVASGYFSPAIFACSNTPDGCYVDQAGTQQPRRLQKVGWIYGIGSAHGACIIGQDGICYALVDQCPNAPSSPTPVVPPSATPTKVPTPGPTPACVRVTVTPASICVTVTPTSMTNAQRWEQWNKDMDAGILRPIHLDWTVDDDVPTRTP